MEIVGSLSGDVPPIKSEQGRPQRLGGLHGARRQVQRARTLHRADRFRVDRDRRLQSAPQRDLPRRCQRREPHASLTRSSTARTPRIFGPSRRLREADRRGGAGHPAQRQPEQRPDVHGRDVRRAGRSTAELAAMRTRYEPLVEVTQIKGDGEAHPMLSPNDEFADYENWDKSNLNGTEAKKPEMLQWEYAREALKTGLELERQLGVNPYKFGMIGSTDAHTSMAAVEEDNFFGKHSGVEPEPHRWEHVVIEAPDPELHDQRLAAGRGRLRRRLGDREHARGDLRRHEAQGDLCDDRPTHDRALLRRLGLHRGRCADRACPRTTGYAKGVPMGGDLRTRPAGKAPTFLVAAMKDPLQRQSRPHPDRQGLARRGRRRPRRRSTTSSGPATASPAPTASCRRSATRSTSRRRPGRTRSASPGADRRLDRSRFRPGSARLLLRSRDRDPHAALDRLRGQAFRHADDGRRAHDHPGTRLHLADLVHAGLR